MKTIEIINILKTGKKPFVVLTSNPWEESWGEKGMIARITKFEEKDNMVKIWFDYNEKKEHNLSLQFHGWHIGGTTEKTGTAFEAGKMNINDIQESVYFEYEDPFPAVICEVGPLKDFTETKTTQSYVEYLEAKLNELNAIKA